MTAPRDPAFKRGPNWNWFFRPRGELVEIALHHERFSIRPEEVRGPIEARWNAFRYREQTPSTPVRTVFGREGAPLAYGTRILTTPWNALITLAPVIGALWIAGRLLGLW